MNIMNKAEHAGNLAKCAVTAAKNAREASAAPCRRIAEMTVRIKSDKLPQKVLQIRKYIVERSAAAAEYALPVWQYLSPYVKRYLSPPVSRCTAWVMSRSAPFAEPARGILNKLAASLPRRERKALTPPEMPDFTHGFVCVQSFFNGYLNRALKVRRAWIVATAALCASLMMTTAVANSLFTFELYVDGRGIGETMSIFEVDKIVADAECQLEEILGYEYSLNRSVSVSASMRKPEKPADELKKALISSVDGVEERYTLVVHGDVVAAVDEEEVLTEILDDVLNEYSSDATDTVRFVDDVTVVRQFVSTDVVKEPEEILTMITPANSESEYALAVENVESALISEEIPYEVEYVEDPELYEGESVVLTEGESGVALITERLVLLNGVEQSRENAGRVVTKQPTAEVIAIGTAQRPKTMSYGTYIWPAEGIISSTYGSRITAVGSSNHKGLDIAGRKGQSIFAADGGEVTFSGWKDAYGYTVVIRHDNGDETVYAHNSALLVSVGERVYQGQEIALMGSTGLSTGVHCHFEIKINGENVNPQKYLS